MNCSRCCLRSILISTFPLLEEAIGFNSEREKCWFVFWRFSDVFFWVLPPPPLKWRVVAYLSKKWDIFCSCLICHLWGQQRFISCLLDASVACRVVSHLLKIGSWACELGENTDHCGAPGLMSQRPWAELVIYFRECCTWGRNADPVVLLNVHMWRELTW